MNPRTALTGMLSMILILSAVLTAPLAWWLLRRYRAAVVRSMNAASKESTAATSASTTPQSLPPGATAVALLDIAGSAPEESAPARQAYHAARSARWKNAAVYAAGGLAYAAVQAVTWMLITTGGFILLRFAWLLMVHAFPGVLAAGLIALAGRRERTVLAALYLAALAAIGSLALIRNPGLTPGELIFYFLNANGPGAVLLLAFLRSGVRAVGPLVLSFMVLSVAGALAAVQAAGTSDAFLRALVAVGSKAGLGGTALFILLHVAGFLIFAVFGWWFLGWIGRRYQAKRLSAQTLTIDSMMMVFAVVNSVSFVFEGWVYVLAGPISFAAYKLTVWAAFRTRARPPAFTPVLMLLRVFALGRRSERLFRKVSACWLHAGSIALIAGPDLATSTIEPHEFFAFLGRRLVRQFVQGPADLQERLAYLDSRPDPDGRYRVNEFFCHRNTWQATMQRLAAVSSAVLMDLRGFSPSNQGCLWELGQLLDAVPLGRVVFVADRTTHLAFLQESLDRLSASLPPDSPNRHCAPLRAHLYTVGDHPDREVDSLLQWVCSAVSYPGRQAANA